ncbi:hypothetical protein GIB67_007075 [Kingdonia uniflora]|uniref:Chlorophyll a-b binding protein, chloroplastic n=1 Tax=Kingdonia uniflora TaxID=39325 RepID=A0A7J7P006_9MAGN|nr:hypothetical protein GIB67_007075 [Kingdonia uniflora]
MKQTQSMKIYMESTIRDHEDESTNFGSTGITTKDIKLCGFDNPTGWWVMMFAFVVTLIRCLPSLAAIPIWIGLYRALSNVTNEGLLTKGFFWIPFLAGPTTIAAKQSGSGISCLFPFFSYEMIHSKWAMLGVASFIIPEAFNKFGSNCGPEAVWFKTGALLLDGNTLNYFGKSIPVSLALAVIAGSFVDRPLSWKEIYPKSKG